MAILNATDQGGSMDLRASGMADIVRVRSWCLNVCVCQHLIFDILVCHLRELLIYSNSRHRS